MIRAAIISLPLLAAACAQRPDSIAATPMPAGMFSAMSCHQARAEHHASTQRLATLSKQQNSAATGDAIGVFLLAVPMSSLTGGDKSGLIAAEKGKVQALDARLMEC
ncbi:hypothetical protein [Falsirhodobacter xinxiangensis]|uniref:hypothetical protein n=1 Tax=Falsirhodobacter xinxiangensis TaxID=2530049 RepID=UPI0010A9F6FD|nr:hypothetical protein [Rhodobacter xinxiangensis]